MLAENQHIILRALREGDFDDFYDYRSDPELCRYQGFDTFSEEETRQFIRDYGKVDLNSVGQWMQIGIEGKDSGRLVGDCALKFREDEPRIVEIGYTINSRYQRKGFATQGLTLLLQTVFQQKDTHKIVALIDERNVASIKLVERLGFIEEGRFRENYYDSIDSAWFDEYQYALLRKDWDL